MDFSATVELATGAQAAIPADVAFGAQRQVAIKPPL